MLKNRLFTKLVLAVLQIAIAISAIAGAILLKFNILNLQIPNFAETSNFYVSFFIVFGIVFIISGLFLVYDWRESKLKREIVEAQ
ncbi:MAG: hypothetical protein ACFCUE_13535 [Candidatus Bathyarchaeia archaeon]